MAGDVPGPRGRRLSEPGQVGAFSLVRPLGEGAMAEVWLAEDAQGRRVALKWLREVALPLAPRFAREIDALSRLEHPGIVRLFASGRAEGRPWLAMEVIDGSDLATLGEKLRARPVSERHQRARDIGLQLADALGYLHGAGLVHRDVKPANVLWAAGRAVLADFGVVAAVDAPADAGFVGSRAWAAPEALAGAPVGPPADQYGFGLVLYWLLTGQRPFDEARHRRAAPRAPSLRDATVPADLEAVILRCLAPEPRARFPNMAAVAAALGALPANAAPAVAGRQAAADRIATALDTVAAGRGVILQLVGAPGAGQAWLAGLARDVATRRDLSFVSTNDEVAADRAAERIRGGEALLLVTEAAVAAAEVLDLPPVGAADLRRSIYAIAPRTPELAAAAERLRAWTGGHLELIEAALGTGVVDGHFDLARAAPPDLAPYLDGLDLDAECVAQALAALEGAHTADVLEQVAAAPAPESLGFLAARGVAERVGTRWLLAAECFRAPLRARALDGLLDRAAAATPSRPDDDPVLKEARAHVDAGRHTAAVGALLAGVEGGATAERRLLLAALHWTLRDPSGALVQWQAVLRESGDARHRARAAIGLGVLHLQAGALHPALHVLGGALLDAELANDGRLAALALLNLAEARALSGALAEGLRLGARAREEARGLRDGPLQAKAARAVGQILADLGAFSEAEAVLADAAALARAHGQDEERLVVNVLRAEVALEARPGDRTAAAVALDRLLSAKAGAPDPEGSYAHSLVVRAEAQARLGEAARARASLAVAATAPPVMAVRVALRAAAAEAALGEMGAASLRLQRVVSETTRLGLPLLSWRASVALARLQGQSRPAPDALAEGLGPAHVLALHNRG